MHSIELLPDPATDSAVRAVWRGLIDAGLPSQGRHTGPTNAPHVTLTARPRIGPEHDDALRSLAAESLPLPIELGGLVVFGQGPRGFVLARLVVVESGILRLHRRVHEAVTDPDATEVPTTRPGSWTPHITLASRLDPQQLGAAVAVASSVPSPAEISAAELRRWDSTAKEVTALSR